MARGVLLAVLVAAFLSICVSAESVEEKTLSFSVSAVPGYVSVSTNADAASLLPGMGYKYDLNVSWNVPPESLIGLQANEVVLYVNVRPENGSDTYFLMDGRKSSELFFSLRCIIEDGACANASILERKANFVYTFGADQNATVGTVFVSASLSPFAGEQERQDAQDLFSELANLPLSDGLAAHLASASAAVDDGDYGRANEELLYVEQNLPPPTPLATPAGLFAGIAQMPSITLPSLSLNLNFGEDSKKIAAALIALVLVGAIGFAAFSKTRRGSSRRRGIDGMDDYEVRGRDYREETPSQPGEVEYRAPPAPSAPAEDENSIVKRVPDWLN